MAPLPVIADVFRVAFNWTNSGVPSLTATNVMHFRDSGALPADIASAIDTHWDQHMLQLESSSSRVSEYVVTPLDGTGASYTFNTGSVAKYHGFSPTNEFEPQLAAIVKFSTAKRGRSYRGRLYLPWVLEGSVSNGLLDSGERTTAQTAWQGFATAMASAGTVPVVASYTLASAEPITSLKVEQFIATQRRRNKRTSI